MDDGKVTSAEETDWSAFFRELRDALSQSPKEGYTHREVQIGVWDCCEDGAEGTTEYVLEAHELTDLADQLDALEALKAEFPADLWAEIHRLRAAVKGPDGFASWQDAATHERIRCATLTRERDKAQDHYETAMAGLSTMEKRFVQARVDCNEALAKVAALEQDAARWRAYQEAMRQATAIGEAHGSPVDPNIIMRNDAALREGKEG